jgi:L-seryl-tRNA(Ser) seleniumtransferase
MKYSLILLACFTLSAADLARRAHALAATLPAGAGAAVVPGVSEVGGGSFPGAELPTSLVRLGTDAPSADELAARLRRADPPVIVRIDGDRVVLDPRTILAADEPSVVRAIRQALDA